MIRILSRLACLFCLVASAQGFSWTPPAALDASSTPSMRFDTSLSVATDGAGTWLSTWCSNTTVGAEQDILCVRSMDNGTTWSDPAILGTRTSGSTASADGVAVAPGTGGRWLALWSSDDTLTGTVQDDKDILYSTSGDSGASWSSSAAVDVHAATDNRHDYAPAVAMGGTGHWVVAWEAYEFAAPVVIGSDSDIMYALSSDDGASWSTPVPLNTNATGDTRLDRAVQIATDHAGSWIAVWQSVSPVGDVYGTDWDVFISRSSDEGSTWTTPVALNTNALTDSGADMQPGIATDGSGNWVAVWSSNDSLANTIGTDDDILFSRSTNNGATWSTPAYLNSNAVSDEGNDSAPVIVCAGTRFVVLWNSTDRLGGVYPIDLDIMYSYSTDSGVTWSSTALLNSDATLDSAHDCSPMIAADSSGHLVAVWRTLLADRTDALLQYSVEDASAAVPNWCLY